MTPGERQAIQTALDVLTHKREQYREQLDQLRKERDQLNDTIDKGQAVADVIDRAVVELKTNLELDLCPYTATTVEELP